MNLFFEGIAVGVVVVVVGYFVSLIVGKVMAVDMPKVCRQWNKNHIMELSLFLTGFLLHVGLDLIGLNRWYCKNCAGCK